MVNTYSNLLTVYTKPNDAVVHCRAEKCGKRILKGERALKWVKGSETKYRWRPDHRSTGVESVKYMHVHFNCFMEKDNGGKFVADLINSMTTTQLRAIGLEVDETPEGPHEGMHLTPENVHLLQPGDILRPVSGGECAFGGSYRGRLGRDYVFDSYRQQLGISRPDKRHKLNCSGWSAAVSEMMFHRRPG